MTYIDGKWRQSLHLEPPHGWMNDPNGLCFFNGFYHVYFQYSPADAKGGGMKCWGHYRSPDLIKWEFTDTVLFPNTAEDKDGVFSGCGVVWNDVLYLFYTGNVMEEGEHDYTRTGRGANVICVTTTDGDHMSPKKVLLRNSDYPDFCSCHVRDPKVWRENGKWHMVLGARTLEDKGCVLFYTSLDLINWVYEGSDSIPDFGYMWECPDIFKLNGHKYLSVSPQGLRHGETKFQNVYQSGYFHYDDGIKYFTEWDMGFDFYAPQTFEAPDGRRLLIGWMGIGDIPYSNPTVALGYQHCLTLPREITADEEGNLMQNPVRELQVLRKNVRRVKDKETVTLPLPFDFTADVCGSFCVIFEDALRLNWDGSIFEMRFTDEDLGGKRTVRKTILEKCADIRIIVDKSSLEIYLDGGRKVLSSRFYPNADEIRVSMQGFEAEISFM